MIRHTCVEDPGTQFIFWYNIIGVSCFYGIVLLTIGLLYRQVPSVIIIIVLPKFNKSTSIAPDEGLRLTFSHIISVSDRNTFEFERMHGNGQKQSENHGSATKHCANVGYNCDGFRCVLVAHQHR